ncbi:hypothetical protein OED01_10575 [Microbacterium sp. M28]|uniref:hypothetical protein n=1 Tax=Microbacterium sp. M28 TaxID=2962064 RepID=UPI0021F4DBE4|nr:hypothetical protein [Microbacterium sp. M28]UYO96049.1 hypothetical protein OED01_10575 [Microbacterium sp. M28]
MSEIVAACTLDPETAAFADASAALARVEATYAALASDGRIFEFESQQPGISPEVADNVSWAYDIRLSSKKGPGRAYYDEMRLQAPGGSCTNCMARDAAALDHYLPKIDFPVVAIQPTNLLPICTACNGTKLKTSATEANEQFLHPFFDRLGPERWMGVTVLEEPSSPTVFEVRRPANWDDTLYERVQNHFERFQLGVLLSQKAGTLMGNHRLAFESFFADALDGDGPAAVRREAARLALSYAAQPQSAWAAAAFEAWSNSTWFCSGGWRMEDDRPLDSAMAHRLAPADSASAG